MKKMTFLMTLISVALSTLGQLKPVSNLTWSQTYVYPNNYFKLTWHSPSMPHDTLVGYNVYRDSILFRFQTDTILNHEFIGMSNCPDDQFLWNNGNSQFYIHVNAVYNSNHIESGYIDSAYTYGYATGISEVIKDEINIYPIPSNGILKIDLQNYNKIEILNNDGSKVLEIKNATELNLRNLVKGIYYVKVSTANEVIIKKIILE